MPGILDPQGRPQPLDAPAQAEPVRLDPLDEGRELTAREAREAFELLFCDLMLRVNNQRVFDAAKRKG